MTSFIRNRAPLKPATQNLLPSLSSQLSPQEMLMGDIRGGVAKQGLKKIETVKIINSDPEHLGMGTVVEKEDIVIKKVIDLDQSFADNILNFDVCGDRQMPR